MIFEAPLPDASVDQGDIIDGCPLHHLESFDRASLLAERELDSVVSTYSRVLVLTQTCDLAQKKSSAVLIAVVRDAAEMVRQGILKAVDVQGPIRGGRVFGWYYLPSFEPSGLPESVLAHPIDHELGPESIGVSKDFAAEWKWDGIRGQVIRRDEQVFIWSRGEELMENRWPEIESAAQLLPDGTVLDGEILASLGENQVLPFANLQRRIGRKVVSKKLLKEVPVIFQAFDLLQEAGEDIRSLPFSERRERLDRLLSTIDHPHLCRTQLLQGASWGEWAKIRDQSREMNAEGLMLKRWDASYEVGRVRGIWWKWKVSPFTIDAVLIYAQKGHGKRSGLYTDYTFALWDGETLVPFAKAYSGLDDEEIKAVDRFIRQNTRESFGPVRSVAPALVMEIAFEGLQRSPRHKSGIATRFPRIVRWRQDKKPEDANTLAELVDLLPKPE